MSKCENCKNCPLLKETKEVLLKVFMYNDGSHHFDCCFNEKNVMKENDNPNVKCFTRHNYKNLNINWNALQNYYEENKDAFGAIGIK